MLTTADLLSRAKAVQHLSSNSRLARALDVPEKTVQRWNTGATTPDDAHALRLAELAELDPAQVLVSMAAARAASGPGRTLWESIARQLERVPLGSAIAVILAVGFFGGGGDAQASPSGSVVSNARQSVYYVNSWLRRMVCALLGIPPSSSDRLGLAA